MSGSTFFLVNVAGLTTTKSGLALGNGAATSPSTGSQLSITPGWKVGTSTAGKSSPMSTGGGGIQAAATFVTSPASPPTGGPTAGSLSDCYVGSVDSNGDTLPLTGTFASGTVVTASFSLRASGTAVSGSVKIGWTLWVGTQPSGQTSQGTSNMTQVSSGTVNTGNSGAISTSASTVVTGNFTLGSTLTLQGKHLFLEVGAIVVTASASANAEFIIEQNANSFINFSNSFVADTLGRIQTLSGDTSNPTGPITTLGFGLPVRTGDIIVATILRTPQTVGGDVTNVKDSSTGTPTYTSLRADQLGDSQALMTSFFGRVATSTTAIGMTITFTLSLSGGNSDASGIIEWTLAVYRSSSGTPSFGATAGAGNASGTPVTTLSCGPLNVPAGAIVYVFSTHQSGRTNYTFTDGTTITIDDEAANDNVGEGRFPSANGSYSPALTSTGGANGAQIMAVIIQLPATPVSDVIPMIGGGRRPMHHPIYRMRGNEEPSRRLRRRRERIPYLEG